jgi:hypothetical protein
LDLDIAQHVGFTQVLGFLHIGPRRAPRSKRKSLFYRDTRVEIS